MKILKTNIHLKQMSDNNSYSPLYQYLIAPCKVQNKHLYKYLINTCILLSTNISIGKCPYKHLISACYILTRTNISIGKCLYKHLIRTCYILIRTNISISKCLFKHSYKHLYKCLYRYSYKNSYKCLPALIKICISAYISIYQCFLNFSVKNGKLCLCDHKDSFCSQKPLALRGRLLRSRNLF